MSAVITISFAVPAGHKAGDCAMLHGNGGSGDIDWESPLTSEVSDLFPSGGGIFGYGLAPYGHFRYGRCHSMRVNGYGHLPYGRFPYGHGTAVIQAKARVDYCGSYKFGFACYDEFSNPHEGTPEEADVVVHTAPPTPAGLTKNSYDKETDVLILDAA